MRGFRCLGLDYHDVTHLGRYVSMLTLTRALMIIPLFILASCGGGFVTLHSEDEPTVDSAALRLSPLRPGHLRRSYSALSQPGWMTIWLRSFRLPKSQLSSFWSSSPWRDVERRSCSRIERGLPFTTSRRVLKARSKLETLEEFSSWHPVLGGIAERAIRIEIRGLSIKTMLTRWDIFSGLRLKLRRSWPATRPTMPVIQRRLNG